MKRILLLAAALASPSLAAERRFTITDFERVQVEGPFKVLIKTGKAPSARAIGTAHATDGVTVEVQGRTLKIRPNRSNWGGYPGERPAAASIEISGHDLRGITLAGSGSVEVDRIKAMRFDLALSGSGSAAIAAIEADALTLGLVGAGRIAMAGKVKTLRATVQGTGDLEAGGLTAEDLQLSADTSGTISLRAGRAAKVQATGSGETNILGNPACTVKNIGSGAVLCGGN